VWVVDSGAINAASEKGTLQESFYIILNPHPPLQFLFFCWAVSDVERPCLKLGAIAVTVRLNKIHFSCFSCTFSDEVNPNPTVAYCKSLWIKLI
jgi:hypothetical protein